MADGDYPPIAAHGLIGDLRTAALVATDGTIDWLCLPRFDSPSVFASLLDRERGGHWSIAPSGGAAATHQLYFPDSNVLITRFLSDDGVVELQDFMPVGPEDHEPPRGLVRRIVAVRGAMELEMELRARFDYGRYPARVEAQEDARAVTLAHGDRRLRLRGTSPLERGEGEVRARVALEQGEAAAFVLDVVPGEGAAETLTAEAATESFDATVAFWRDWLAKGRYRGRWREMVERSALTLKLLSYRPTGAILAAPTASLPEHLGGERNWDYRYVWSRDAAFAAYALLALGYTDEAGAFVDWLTDRLRDGDDGEEGETGPLRVLYDLDGNHCTPERELEHLSGYEGSAPVRIGNDADTQLQLDIYGEVIDSVYLSNKYASPISSDTWRDVARVVDWVCENWDREDEGIWETRAGRQHHTSSRLMCWVAIERAVRMARQRGLPADLARWIGARDAIYAQLMERGFDSERGTFVGHYGSHSLDASLLLMPMLKFVSPADPKFLATLDAIAEELVSDSLVYRYDPELSPDGVHGREGTFSICSFWYVEALTRVGRLEDARLALEKMFTYANHLGLYAEQIGQTGRQLGNFPQAFTHLALISSAINLDRALGD